MRIIKVLDHRDYLESWDKIERHAVRAIIRKDNLMSPMICSIIAL